MSEAISLEFIGSTLRAIQAEQRNARAENELIRGEIGRLAGGAVTRELLSEVLRLLMERIGNFEALMETRLDQLLVQLAQRDAKP